MTEEGTLDIGTNPERIKFYILELSTDLRDERIVG